MSDAEASDAQVLPVYILLDVSYSMTGEPIQAANEIIPALIDACNQYNVLAEFLRFSLITFSDTAKVVVPMSQYDEARVPQLGVEGGTSYNVGFAAARSQIENDIETLKADGYRVFRPSIFFITDGDPTDTPGQRDSAWKSLTDSTWRSHPNVIAFGVGGGVTEDILKTYVSHKGKAFVSKSGVDAAGSLRSIIEMLVLSVVASANGASSGDMGGLVLNTAAIDDDMDEVV